MVRLYEGFVDSKCSGTCTAMVGSKEQKKAAGHTGNKQHFTSPIISIADSPCVRKLMKGGVIEMIERGVPFPMSGCVIWLVYLEMKMHGMAEN